MFQGIAVAGVFLACLLTLVLAPPRADGLGHAAPAAAGVHAPLSDQSLIADTTEDAGSDDPGDGEAGSPVPTTPPDLPAPDPFEGVDVESTANVVVTMPVAEPPPATWSAGPPLLQTSAIIAAAQSLLGVPYVWGGNTLAGMDCSAYVSRVWGISRQTTDTIHAYSRPITKDQLLPGDAMNLTRAQDPRGYGHIRIFAAWANEERSLMWVYEETPRQSVYHVISYDARYTPIRRNGTATEGVTAPLIPAPVTPKRTTSSNDGTRAARASATPTPTPARTPRATSTPRTTPTPRATSTFTRLAATATPTRTPSPVPTPRATRTPSPVPTPRVTRTASPTPTRTPSPTPTRTPSPTPSATPGATPTATPIATPVPTTTPVPTATATPGATPSATPPAVTMPGPAPTATPAPTPAAAPTATAAPTSSATPAATAPAAETPAATPGA